MIRVGRANKGRSLNMQFQLVQVSQQKRVPRRAPGLGRRVRALVGGGEYRKASKSDRHRQKDEGSRPLGLQDHDHDGWSRRRQGLDSSRRHHRALFQDCAREHASISSPKSCLLAQNNINIRVSPALFSTLQLAASPYLELLLHPQTRPSTVQPLSATLEHPN